MGTGASGISVRAAVGGVGETSLCVAAHAVRHRRTQQRAYRCQVRRRARAGLAKVSHGQLPIRHDGSRCRGRPGGRRVDARLRSSATRAAPQGHDVVRIRTKRRRVRLRDHGNASPSRGEAGRRSGHRRDTEALLPLLLQTTVFSRRVPARLQQPPRHADRLSRWGRKDHRARAGRGRTGVRSRLHHLRHRIRARAHSPGSPCRPRDHRSRESLWPRSGPAVRPPCSA